MIGLDQLLSGTDIQLSRYGSCLSVWLTMCTVACDPAFLPLLEIPHVASRLLLGHDVPLH